MNRKILIPVVIVMAVAGAGIFYVGFAVRHAGGTLEKAGKTGKFAGSKSCRECHEKFYRLWATSHHGLAMQPFSRQLAEKHLIPQEKDVVVGKYSYRAKIEGKNPSVIETGPGGSKSYPVEHVLGGKNIYYFLTPRQRGRLQVLPVAFDVRNREWIDTTGSMVRHAIPEPDQALHWTDSMLTFNTSCYGCHVSQLVTNYDLSTDSYDTRWSEPGINCESCHGPSAAHVKKFRNLPKGEDPGDPELVTFHMDDVTLINETCLTCHAKAVPITNDFEPGNRFFDHYGLTTLEDCDFYPDGRDLGENYTMTTWRMSPCVQSGKLSCAHCHTSSGRYRFAGPEKANNACLPCHRKRVADPEPHTRHKKGTPGSRCIDCHMPMTIFARMQRSDHSMLPPTPVATTAFKSPNACNICHTRKEENAEWADKLVRKWHGDDYQDLVLYRAGLIDAAKKGDWKRLPEILKFLESEECDEIHRTSLIRLLGLCPDPKKWPAILDLIRDPSPLVRAAAATELQYFRTSKSADALLEATRDAYRLVRIRAAGAMINGGMRVDDEHLDDAVAELKESLNARPDQWSSHYNLGQFYSSTGKTDLALQSYRTAIKLRPDVIPPRVNASMIHVRWGDLPDAEKMLREALKIAPSNAEVNYNLALLMAEKEDLVSAEKHFRTVLKTCPEMANAAYNLGVLLIRDRREQEGFKWLREAVRHGGGDPKYGYSLAFFLNRQGKKDEACRVLEDVIKVAPRHTDSRVLLESIRK